MQLETMVESENNMEATEKDMGMVTMQEKDMTTIFMEEKHGKDMREKENMQEQDARPLEEMEVEGMDMETVATSSGGWSIPPSCRFQTELDHSLAEAKPQTDHHNETGRPIIALGAQPGRTAWRRDTQGG